MTDIDTTDFPSANAIIAAFGGIRPTAARLDVPVSTVQGWKQRDAIPENRHDEIRAAAEADGIDLHALPEGAVEEEVEDTGTPDDSPQAAPGEAAGAGPDGDAGGEAPSPRRVPPARSGGAPMAVAVVALIVAVAAAGWSWWAQQAAGERGMTDRIAALEGEIAALDRVRGELGALRAEVAGLKDRPAPADDSAALAALRERIDALAASVAALSAQAAADDGARLDALARDIEDVKAAASANIAAVSALRTGVDNTLGDLSARVTGIENQSGNAAATEARAVGLAIAAAELRRTVRSGAPYGATLDTLRELASGTDRLVPHLATLAKSASDGVPTLADLSRRFDALVGDILAAERAGSDAPWYRQVLDRVASVVTVRRIGGDAGGDSTDAVVARAEARLAAGDLDGAVGEVASLSGDAARIAAPWLAQARTVLAAEAAIAAINSHALSALARARGG